MYDGLLDKLYSEEWESLCRFCGVRREHREDLRQEISLFILTHKPQVKDTGNWLLATIKKQYWSRNSIWYKKERRWEEIRVRLSQSGGEIPDKGSG